MPLHATFANPFRHSSATSDRRPPAAINDCQISQAHHSGVQHQQFLLTLFPPRFFPDRGAINTTCWLICNANLCRPPTLACVFDRQTTTGPVSFTISLTAIAILEESPSLLIDFTCHFAALRPLAARSFIFGRNFHLKVHPARPTPFL